MIAGIKPGRRSIAEINQSEGGVTQIAAIHDTSSVRSCCPDSRKAVRLQLRFLLRNDEIRYPTKAGTYVMPNLMRDDEHRRYVADFAEPSI